MESSGNKRSNVPGATRNDLPADVRSALIGLLNARLAGTIDLRIQAKQAHWNIRGPRFIALHELFDQVASAGSSFQDLLGERAAQLGGYAEGTLEAVASATPLASYPVALSREEEHVQRVADALARVAGSTRSAIKTAEDYGDAATADIFTEITKEADKLLWFVEAHLEAYAEEGAREARPDEEGYDGEQPASPEH